MILKKEELEIIANVFQDAIDNDVCILDKEQIVLDKIKKELGWC